MYDPRYNNNVNSMQNNNMDTTLAAFQNPYFGQNATQPYRENISIPMPQPMSGNMTESGLYPLEGSLAAPNLNQPQTPAYAKGGRVKKKKGTPEYENAFPSLAEMIRQQGEGEDKILAHINPREAHILSLMSGGSINPKTGLPQFGLFDNPKKWLKSSIGGLGGAILGNMILPGIGGMIGGGLGNAAGSALRGRKDYLEAGLRGVGMGAVLPTVSSLAGSGLSSLGFGNVGNQLSNYGATNAILPSVDKLAGTNLASMITGTGGGNMINAGANAAPNAVVQNAGGAAQGASGSWWDKLLQPKNLLTAASVASSFHKKKEKSPEKLAQEEKRRAKALQLTPQELREKEAYDLAVEQAKRRIEMNKYLPEERFHVAPLHRYVNSPEEMERDKGRWMKYYNNSEMRGEPIYMKKGGHIPKAIVIEEEIDYPMGMGLGHFLQGLTGGQDDQREARVSDGEYVIPSDVVAHIGDGNNNAGADRIDELIVNVRKHKTGHSKFPPKAKSLADYMRAA